MNETDVPHRPQDMRLSLWLQISGAVGRWEEQPTLYAELLETSARDVCAIQRARCALNTHTRLSFDANVTVYIFLLPKRTMQGE